MLNKNFDHREINVIEIVQQGNCWQAISCHFENLRFALFGAVNRYLLSSDFFEQNTMGEWESEMTVGCSPTYCG